MQSPRGPSRTERQLRTVDTFILPVLASSSRSHFLTSWDHFPHELFALESPSQGQQKRISSYMGSRVLWLQSLLCLTGTGRLGWTLSGRTPFAALCPLFAWASAPKCTVEEILGFQSFIYLFLNTSQIPGSETPGHCCYC